MMKNIVLLLLFSGGMCAAQSTLVTPVLDARQNPEDTRNTGRTTQRGGAQPGNPQDNGVSDLNRDESQVPLDQRLANEEAAPRSANGSSRIVGPLRTKSEFQQYAEDATGRQLPVFGRQMFDQVPTTFAPVENAPVPADYVLGPDDQLLIRAWGKIELNSRVTIDRNGQISLPKVGSLTVAGLRYSQVESFLRSAIGALFKDFELNVTMGQLRSIQIYVLGNARQPGSYTVSSLSTLVTALFSSGGPSATGTMRDIQLRREGKTISDFDIYDLVANGDKSKDTRLLPGDIIFIPTIGAQVAISGDVNQPGIFELKGSTTAGEAVAFAGGMTSLASVERAVLERIEKHSNRKVEEFSLDPEGQAKELLDGDILRIFPLSPKFANAVTLRGNVAVPGLYPWKEGMRISDLIPSRSILITRDYWNEQNHLVQPIARRPFSDTRRNFPDAPGSGAIDDRRSDAIGNPRNGGSASQGDEYVDNRDANPSYNQGKDSRITRAVKSIGQNSTEINWEYALIERLDQRDLSTQLIPFRLASAIDDPGSADNQALKPGDIITVFSRADLELPMEKHAMFVRIGGEVNAPGIYRVHSGETLRDVIKTAGGLTNHSYLYASLFTRESTRLAQEAELRQATDQMQRELISSYANAARVPGESATDQQGQLAMQQAAVSRFAAIKPTGRVVLTMRPTAADVEDIPNFPLEDGDAYYIPPRMSTVQVSGAVYNANAFRYMPGERLVKYLDAAGGATRNADAKRAFIIRADGTVISRQAHSASTHGSFEHLRLLPGDSIVVPEKLRVSSKMNEFLQWTQLTTQLAITSAALNAIR